MNNFPSDQNQQQIQSIQNITNINENQNEHIYPLNNEEEYDNESYNESVPHTRFNSKDNIHDPFQQLQNEHLQLADVLPPFPQSNLNLSITQQLDDSQHQYFDQNQQNNQQNILNATQVIRTSFESIPFWTRRKQQAHAINYDEKKARAFPEMRIRRLMKSELQNHLKREITEMMMKACELFIMELTDKTIKFALKSKRKSIRVEDIIQVLIDDHKYDFCIDLIAMQENVHLDLSNQN